MLPYNYPKLRVLIADDHELVRFSLKLALQRHPNIDLVGLASNGQEAIDMVQEHQPDVVILDLQMPIMDGLSASNAIKTQYPNIQILAYSSVKDPQVEVMIQTAKIDAFCEKAVPIQDLVDKVNELGQRAINRQ